MSIESFGKKLYRILGEQGTVPQKTSEEHVKCFCGVILFIYMDQINNLSPQGTQLKSHDDIIPKYQDKNWPEASVKLL